MRLKRKHTFPGIAAAFVLAVTLASCINIKSDFPSIEYYRLKQQEGSTLNIGSISGLLQIRDFTIAEELETNYLLALWDETKIQRYYYHRWIGNCSEMITDFFITRYNKNNAFSEGVVRSSSILLPRYIMEGQVLDMMAHNSPTGVDGGNWVNLSIRINIIRIDPSIIDRQVIHSKVYNTRIPRSSNAVTTIPIAYSQAFSEIADQILADLHQAVGSDQRKNPKEDKPNTQN